MVAILSLDASWVTSVISEVAARFRTSVATFNVESIASSFLSPGIFCHRAEVLKNGVVDWRGVRKSWYVKVVDKPLVTNGRSLSLKQHMHHTKFPSVVMQGGQRCRQRIYSTSINLRPGSLTLNLKISRPPEACPCPVLRLSS